MINTVQLLLQAAAVINALKVAGKKIEDVKIVINGAGAAGISNGKYLLDLGAKNVIWCDRKGVIVEGQEGINAAQAELPKISNPNKVTGLLFRCLSRC